MARKRRRDLEDYIDSENDDPIEDSLSESGEGADDVNMEFVVSTLFNYKCVCNALFGLYDFNFYISLHFLMWIQMCC